MTGDAFKPIILKRRMRIYDEGHEGHEDVELAEEESPADNSPSGLLPRQLPLTSPFRLLRRLHRASGHSMLPHG